MSEDEGLREALAALYRLRRIALVGASVSTAAAVAEDHDTVAAVLPLLTAERERADRLAEALRELPGWLADNGTDPQTVAFVRRNCDAALSATDPGRSDV